MSTTLRERPILFSDPMVPPILDGRKTQTRRVAKPPAKAVFLPDDNWKNDPDEPGTAYLDDRAGRMQITCPYGQPGDRLWVRETFITGYDCDELYEKVWYRATEDSEFRWLDDDGEMTDRIPWKPSIHMPRWASRITLEITAVRIERLQEITREDAIAEGFADSANYSACNHFVKQWSEINGKRHPWVSNPWVWAISFKRVD
jgi:hypothetical protein